MLNRVYGWLWRSYSKLPEQLWAILEWILSGITGRQKQIAEQRPATRPQDGIPEDSHRERIRQLLCDNAACKLCQHAAEEAAQLQYSKGADEHDPEARFERGRVSVLQKGGTTDSDSGPKTIFVTKRAVRRKSKDTFSMSSATYSSSFTSCSESSSGLSACRYLKDFRSRSHVTKQQKAHRTVSQQDSKAVAKVHHLERMSKTTVVTVQSDTVETDITVEEQDLPSSTHVLDSKTDSESKAELQAHFMKTSLERRLEVFPSIVGRSQKMTKLWTRKSPLPKLIRPGQHRPQQRNRQCVSLQGTADAVDMNIKCKYLHFLWGLPTLYMQSVKKIAPSPPSLPKVTSRVIGFVELGHAKPPSVPPKQWRVLELHVLRKRIQHQWGLPGLVQKSLKGFLMSAPPSAHIPSVAHVRLEVRVSVGYSQLLFFSLGIKQHKLENHIKSKIVERRWGLPRRVLEALQKFMPVPPPLIMRSREEEKVYLLPMKRMPSVLTTVSSQKSEGFSKKLSTGRSWEVQRQLLQRHVAKKTLESQLGMPASVVQQSQKMAYQAGKCILSKTIPPRSRPIKPRSQELPFLNEATLSSIQINIIHKNLTFKWERPKMYQKSLVQLMQHSIYPTHTARTAVFSFAGRETLFISRRSQDFLEWHLRRKRVHHSWGLPGLIQRSLRSFLPTVPTVPHIHLKSRYKEVTIFQTELPFLSRATRQVLERNVQKRVIHQRWLLPRRVLESLKHLYPKYVLDSMMSVEPFDVGVVRKEQGVLKKAPRMTEAPRQPHMQLRPSVRVNLQRHLAKKSLEVHLEALPSIVRVSWGYNLQLVKRPLPKMIPPGKKVLVPRRSLLPFASQKQVDRIDVAVCRNHLARLWELSVRYVEALGGLMLGPPIHSLKQRQAAFDFRKVQLSLPPGLDRDALERHVQRKRLQHEWGIPALIHRSLKHLMHRAPALVSSIQIDIYVNVLLPEQLFLPHNICHHLEIHLQRMKLQRLWGLPRRIMDSLKLFLPHPEWKATAVKQKPPTFPLEPGAGGFSGKVGSERLSTSPVLRKTAAATVPAIQKVSKKGHLNLEKIRLHLAKKWVEMQLEAFPAVVVHSWRHTVLISRQPLPRLVPRGCRPLQVRKCFLPFVLKRQAGRIEMSVHLSRLSSLWGLGTRYAETLQALLPRRPFSQHLRCQKVALRFTHAQAPCIQGKKLDLLELHVRKKRVQHEWGIPLLIQRSLKSFMQDFPPGPGFRKTMILIQVLQQELLFVPQGTCNHLEHHIQRVKLQRQWGLPKRVLESLRLLFPKPPHERKKALSERSFSREPSRETHRRARSTGTIDTKRDRKEGPKLPDVTPVQIHPCQVPKEKVAKKLQRHLSKKSLEVHLEVFPAIFRISRRRASLPQKQALPKPIQPNLQSLKPRSSSFSVGKKNMNRIELAVQRHHFASLWGLGTRYVEAVSKMTPKLPCTPSKLRVADFEYSAVKTPFLRQKMRESLELHVGKKRLQHLWGFPVLVQSSIQGFIGQTPARSTPSKSVINTYVLHQELMFLPADTCNHLEHHIQRMKLQRKWGLPRKVLRHLKSFFPLGSSQRSPSPQKEKKPSDPVPNPLPHKALQAGKAAGGGALPHGCDVRKCTVRLPQITYTDTPSKEVSAGAPTPFYPIVELFENSDINVLETHLKKKSLEIKFQLIPPTVLPKKYAGSIKSIPLPKLPLRFPMVKPRRAYPLFVEESTVAKIQLNISFKYLAYLWGLPSAYTESLRKLFGRVPEPPMPRNGATLSDTQKEPMFSREATREAMQLRRLTGTPVVPREADSKRSKSELTFLTNEALDLLESHIRSKMLQHMWGLPATIQKSLHRFAPINSELQTSLEQKGAAATHSKCATETDVAIQSLEFLDPAVIEKLQAHIKRRITAHRWHLPMRIQEMLMRLLTPKSAFQAERSKAQVQTRPCPCTQTFQAAPQQVLRCTNGLPKNQLHQGKSEATFPPCVTSSLEFHIRQKRIQHEWGLPSTVQRSLLAFAQPPLPPRPRSTRAGLAASATSDRVADTGKRREDVHIPPPAIQVITSSHDLPFMSPETTDDLESHLRSRAAKHKWKLPKLLQDLLRILTPRQSETDEKPNRSVHQGKQTVAKLSASRESTAFLPPEPNLRFLPREIQNLLKFHIQNKKIQHIWGLPNIILKSLGIFAPFPQSRTEKHTPAVEEVTIAPRSKGDVHVTNQTLSFLRSDMKERLESHVRHLTAKHRWGLPKHIQKSLKAFRPARPSPEESRSQTQQCDAPSPQDSFSKPRLEAESSGQSFQGSTRCGVCRSKLSPDCIEPSLTASVKHVLELHLQRKKVQHEWGLPAAIQKSLKAFAPDPQESQGRLQSADDGNVAAGRRKNIFARNVSQCKGTMEVSAAAQKLQFLDSETKEVLEAHVRTRTTEHRWQLPGLLQKAVRPFVLAASSSEDGGTQDQGQLSTDFHGKTQNVTSMALEAESEQEAPSSPKLSHRFCPELICQTGPDGGSISQQTAAKTPPCPAAELRHSTGTSGGGNDRRAARRTGSVHKKPVHRPRLQVPLKKATNRSSSRVSLKTGLRHVAKSKKDAKFSRNSEAEQICRQQEEGEQGKAAQTNDEESQNFHNVPSRKSVKCTFLPEEETAPRCKYGMVSPIMWATRGSSTDLSHRFKSNSAYEDMVPMHYKQPGRGHQGRGSRKLERKRSTIVCSRASRETLLFQAPEYGAAYNISVRQTSQGNPKPDLQPQTSKAEAQRPLSIGVVSQFSTEHELEIVGDWDSEEEPPAKGTGLGRKEGGSTKAAEEQMDPRYADSPAVKQLQESLESSLIREAKSILGDQMLCLTTVQTDSESFGHHNVPQSAIGQMGSDVVAHLLPKEPSGTVQTLVFSEEMQASAEVKGSEILLPSEKGERTAVGEVSIVPIEPGAGMAQMAGKELSCQRKASPKEPSVGQEAFVVGQQEESEMVHVQRTGQPLQQNLEPQFGACVCISEKCSLLGKILEKKLSLEHGLRIWRRSNERLDVCRERNRKERGTRKSEINSYLGKPPEIRHGQ